MDRIHIDINEIADLDRKVAIAGAIAAGDGLGDDTFSYLFAVAVSPHK